MKIAISPRIPPTMMIDGYDDESSSDNDADDHDDDDSEAADAGDSAEKTRKKEERKTLSLANAAHDAKTVMKIKTKIRGAKNLDDVLQARVLWFSFCALVLDP